ncbi:MAG: TM2 domain-containing protein [Acetobacter sp.]
MRGTVLDYDPRNGEGLISGDDNNRYSFKGVSVKSDFNALRKGVIVDFDVQNNEAVSVFMITPPSSSGINIDLGASGDKSKIVAGLLAILFGGLGLHKFYLGYTKQGLIMLFITLSGFLFLGIPSAFVYLIAFIEGIIYITKSDQDFNQIYVVNKKEWF